MLFRYLGAKSRHFDKFAPYFMHKCDHLFPHLSDCRGAIDFREPFSGSISFFPKLARQPFFERVGTVWINDLDPGIASIWRAVCYYPEELRYRLRDYHAPTRQGMEELAGKLKQVRCLPRGKDELLGLAVKSLVVRCLAWGGLSRFTPGTENLETWSVHKVRTLITEWHERLSRYRVRVSCLDFGEVIRSATRESLLYIDPPYHQLRYYGNGMTWQDHVRLANALSRTPAKWVMSHSDHPAIRDLYQWARIREVPFSYCFPAARRQSTELVILG